MVHPAPLGLASCLVYCGARIVTKSVYEGPAGDCRARAVAARHAPGSQNHHSADFIKTRGMRDTEMKSFWRSKNKVKLF